MIKYIFFNLFLFVSLSGFSQSDDYLLVMQQGEEAEISRQYAQAIQYFDQAIKLDPNRPEAYLKQMESAIKKRDLSVYKKTILQLESLQYPLVLDIYITFAQLAKKQRMYNDGLVILKKAEKMHGVSITLLFHRAELYHKLNNNTEAINTLKQAQRLYPKNLEVRHKLATTYIEIDRSISIKYFTELLNEEYYKDAALSSLGLLYTKRYESAPTKNRNDLIKALNYYEQYLKRHPQDQDTKNIIEHISILLDS